MKNQRQVFYDAHRHMADVNNTFLDMVKGGLTSDDLMKLIERDPQVWSRFANWLDKLPKESQ